MDFKYEPMPPMALEWLMLQNQDFGRWLQNLRNSVADILADSITNERLAWINEDGQLVSKDLVDIISAAGNVSVTVGDDSAGGVTIAIEDLINLIADAGSDNIVVTDDTAGGVTLDTAQDIDTGDSPTFAGVTLSGLTASRIVATNGTKALASIALASWIAGTTDEITVTDDGDGSVTISLPNSIKLDGATASRLLATDGDKKTVSIDLDDWIAGTADEITVTDDTDGSVTLSLPRFSFSNDKMFVTNVATARAIDRTSDVVTSTTTVSNTTTETTIFTGTIAANALRAGNVLKVYAKGVLSTDSAADDITLRGYIGSTLLGAFNPAIGNVSDALWELDAMLTVRSIGASGSIAWDAKYDIDGNTTEGEDISTVDTTAAEDFTVTVEWDNAKAGNTISIYQGILEWKN